MRELRIADIPTIKELVRDARTFSRIARVMPLLRPFLRLFGVDVAGLDKAFSEVDDLTRRTMELASVPDRFNGLFAERGWIMYGGLNFDVAKSAIEKAEAGDFEAAEADLVGHYDGETVRMGLMGMYAVEAFRLRMPLAEKALADYVAERYHACVPVVLALLDGMTNEVYQRAHGGKRRGISSEDVDLYAWDSVGGHDSGLNQLVKRLHIGRRRTTTEPVTMPYRHGIMHGIDLGYDNRIVAAKTWALLFASRDWAVKAERGQLEPAPPVPPPSLRESLAKLRESRRRADETGLARQRLAEWKPRTLQIGVDVPASGALEGFEVGTPERKAVEYLTFWKARNYGKMAQCIDPLMEVSPAEVRKVLASKCLLSFELRNVYDKAPALGELIFVVVVEENNQTLVSEHNVEMVCRVSERLASSNEEGAEWWMCSWALGQEFLRNQ